MRKLKLLLTLLEHAVSDILGWATHGGVTEVNAHPHVSGNVTLIHNGIIENYKELAASLKNKKDLLLFLKQIPKLQQC